MKQSTIDDYQEKMLRVLVFIQKNLDRAISLDELAGVAHLSPFHFHRVFKGMVGEAVAGHIRRLRLERAALQLMTTARPVTRIAFDAGYQTLESFSRAFKEMFGLSPSGFRKKRGLPHAKGEKAGIHYDPGAVPLMFTPLHNGGEKMEVEIKAITPRKVAFVRHLGPYAKCEPAWRELCEWAGGQGLLTPDAVFLGICYDDPEVTQPDKIRYDASILLTEEVSPGGKIGVQEIAGGDFACTVHKGPFDTLNQTYATLMGQWLPAQKRMTKNGPSIEICLNDPDATPPEELLTEIQVPLEKAG